MHEPVDIGISDQDVCILYFTQDERSASARDDYSVLAAGQRIPRDTNLSSILRRCVKYWTYMRYWIASRSASYLW